MTHQRRTWRTLAAVAAVVLAAVAFKVVAQDSADRTDVVRAAVVGGRAKTVILFIGDGMGDSEITLARNYQVGAAGRLAMDALPLTGAYTTYALQEADPTKIDYVTDSAASATGWATGVKTSNGRLSTSAGTTSVAPLVTILELAQRAGMPVGSVSTTELTDATPAALASHVNSRACHGPADMAACPAYAKAAGGPGSIAEQTIEHDVNVLLGGGRRRFMQAITAGPQGGMTVVQAATVRGYTIVYDAAGLAAVKPGQRVLGLFNDGSMSLEWGGAPAAKFPGSGPQTCVERQREANTKEPSLAEMTTKAIELLSARPGRSAGGRGFFLQVEGAQIDRQDHAASPCQQIGETIAFDRAIAVGLEFARQHPDTLLIVTADHGHTSQIVPVPVAGGTPRPGLLSTLVTKEGSPITVNYGTGAAGQLQEHTGTQVRIAAQGPQAANIVGVTDQTDLFRMMLRALALEAPPAPNVRSKRP